ncbi:MAG TPA: GrpB family protein [Xanthobacteraceae bacterium]
MDEGDRSATEERLIAATVGKIEPLNRAIALEPYDPEWPSRYAILERQIREALGRKALLIEHVGSTSVPGLSAKPVIDVVLAVANSADESAYVPPLERLGYVLRIREPAWFEHRMLKSPGIDGNIHVFSQACEEIGPMLAFRDRLRADDDDRKWYERTKQELAARTWKYMQNYADAKSGVVREILNRALGAGGRLRP